MYLQRAWCSHSKLWSPSSSCLLSPSYSSAESKSKTHLVFTSNYVPKHSNRLRSRRNQSTVFIVASVSHSQEIDQQFVQRDVYNDAVSGGNTAAKGSGTSARGRRLLKIREEKRKRDFDRLHNYPAWAKVLEDACKNDGELRAVLGDSIGDPELMRKRVEERVRRKGRDLQKSKTGSVVAFKVSFRDFNPLDSFIWFELYGSPSDRDVDLLGSVVQSWYVMGRLGAFNSSNLQLANSSMDFDPLYDSDKGFKVMPSSFHDISDVEFQDNWGRVWVDLGTSDFFSIDILLNCLTVLSSEYLGIQQVVFGGRRLGDWEEGMTSPEDGYKYFKI